MLSVLALVLAADGGVSAADYDVARVTLATRREVLARRWARPGLRNEARREARMAVLDFVDAQAFPAWAGTTWNFYGTSTTPREGAIACGYFVSTVLEHAGFQVERVKLAQQASAYIVSTMARGTHVEWLRYLKPAEVVARVRERFGDGLFVVGMDYHVGFLRLDGERVAFCHSSFLEPAVVACEDPQVSAGFASNLYVVGDALNDAAIDDWLLGRDILTETPPKGSRLVPIEQR
ncbi:MAG: hypothetical protein AB1938_00515 [Myxococcota bacterium]